MFLTVYSSIQIRKETPGKTGGEGETKAQRGEPKSVPPKRESGEGWIEPRVTTSRGCTTTHEDLNNGSVTKSAHVRYRVCRNRWIRRHRATRHLETPHQLTEA